MDTNPVGWFEIPVTDLARAKRFYQAVFGFELASGRVGEYEMEFFPMKDKAMGAAGALITGKGYAPSKGGVVIYFMTNDIPATLAKVEASGGKTTLPKKSIAPHGFIAWFEDTEGNTVALHAMS
jgi:predicted enzyme related to lactoylglutathione lyase